MVEGDTGERSSHNALRVLCTLSVFALYTLWVYHVDARFARSGVYQL